MDNPGRPPGYFATLGIPLVLGRSFDKGDRRDSPFVAIVNQAFAKRYSEGDAVGKRFLTSNRQQEKERNDREEHQADGHMAASEGMRLESNKGLNGGNA